ncbi:protein of unknown function [Taphrina deformans PYCC 5710]|uniref:DUF218 domain-containing protein n=1 Tax=Taphrina deformans (strain PYCC 5710 / ATCC 11124 / CBS 356.35 / IMI 108563 / JCM 9778 / NBRC 8474) TaxID=1097556 RepID=R4XG35_TAPDE|nr:protein of unknown function [Taphrina deformans PYCC 5710]|eukprot:CCG84842.1 protein of unknown function [Taphrina deformans PYCC 5710]
MNADVVQDINIIAKFLANEVATSLHDVSDIDTIVLCGSAILQCSEAVFAALQSNPSLAKTLVISGGIGHSTQFLYDTIASHPRYFVLSEELAGQAESTILYKIFERFYGAKSIQAAGLQVLIDDESTNCGANAKESQNILLKHNIKAEHVIIVQDPTMSRRSLATFEKTYQESDVMPRFTSFPSFVPQIALRDGSMEYNIPTINTDGLWDTQRFCELVLGEIPRMRDDAAGYGPRGKGFITHVDIPGTVEQAWERANRVIETQRAMAMKG